MDAMLSAKLVELISLSFGGRHAEEQGKDFLISTPLFYGKSLTSWMAKKTLLETTETTMSTKASKHFVDGQTFFWFILDFVVLKVLS